LNLMPRTEFCWHWCGMRHCRRVRVTSQFLNRQRNNALNENVCAYEWGCYIQVIELTIWLASCWLILTWLGSSGCQLLLPSIVWFCASFHSLLVRISPSFICTLVGVLNWTSFSSCELCWFIPNPNATIDSRLGIDVFFLANARYASYWSCDPLPMTTDNEDE
jgi:hypothetical protein